jgi:threonine aldolase
MAKTYAEMVKGAKYKLTGNGDRRISQLLESFENMDPSTDADVYGNGSIINDFEDEIAKLLGKDKAVFFPSGKWRSK